MNSIGALEFCFSSYFSNAGPKEPLFFLFIKEFVCFPFPENKGKWLPGKKLLSFSWLKWRKLCGGMAAAATIHN
jgi:hypothetical protein